MTNVFLSYDPENLPLVNPIIARLAALEEMEFTPFLNSFAVGDTRETYIERVLHKSSMVVAFIGSRMEAAQEWEIRKALEIGRDVMGVPITVGGATSLPPGLSIPLVSFPLDSLAAIIGGKEKSLCYEYDFPDDQTRMVQVDLGRASSELTRILANPSEVYRMTSRRFEELVAHLFADMGYAVSLTQQTRDGGLDILALRKDSVGSFLTLVECKKYAPQNRVGVEIVRSMYGVLEARRASHAVIVTTSSFTADARELERDLHYRISLRDHADLFQWIENAAVRAGMKTPKP